MKRSLLYFLIISIWTVIPSVHMKCRQPYVRTSLGGIEGYYKTSENGRKFAAFESVPYAQPPVGLLRFEPPVPISPWNQNIKALSLPPACSQGLRLHGGNNQSRQLVMAEDCLYLNIYVPVTKNNTLLPIIFWIHGGGYTGGSSQSYGPKYLMDRDLILITINYRVGPLGFLSTEDDIVPGNMGLKDQVVALKWVSKNIAHFNGDPKRITLMGVSAGGASVHYHYLSHQTRGLFRNGISFSGSALNPWAFDHRNALKNAKSLAILLKCPVNNSARMLQCLKTKPIEDLIEATVAMTSKWDFPISTFVPALPFVPVAEKSYKNYFINDTPTNIMEKGDVYDAPWIVGAVQEEGLFMTSGFILNETLVKYTDDNWEKIGPLLIFLINKIPLNKHPSLAKKAKENYFGEEPITSDLTSIRKLTHLVGDAAITIGNIRSAKLLAKVNKSPTRFYYYTYRAAQSTSNALSNSTVNLGVSHDDDIFLVLSNKNINPTTTEKDKSMLQDMLNYWYSVVNDGEPNLGTPWPSVNPNAKDLQYMHIAGPKNFIMESSDNLGEIKFWEEIGI